MIDNLGTFLRVLAQGLPPTVIATVGGIALTIVLSLVAGLALLSPSRIVRGVSRIYVEGLRGTSEVVQLFWIFFALPVLVGFQIVPIWAGILVLGLNHGAYGAEIVRGAIQSVPRAQYEGALALSLSPAQRMRRVILPQAFVEMIPPFNNLFIQLLKSTALLSFVFINEITRQATRVLIPRFNPQAFTILLVLLVMYLALSLIITAVMRRARAGRRRAGGARALGTGPDAPDHGGCRMSAWDWDFAADIMPVLLDGLRITLIATLLGSLVAFALGLLLAVLQRGPAPVRVVVRGLVEFIRSTPLLVQLFFLFYVLPQFGITLGALTAGVIALGLHYATYTSEVYRAGIDAVPRGQWEAATALSLPRSRVWTGVILPQAIPRVVPALGNYVISMFKETPLLIGDRRARHGRAGAARSATRPSATSRRTPSPVCCSCCSATPPRCSCGAWSAVSDH